MAFLFLLGLVAVVAAVAFPSDATHVADFDARVQSWAKGYAGSKSRSLVWADAYGKHEHLASSPQYSAFKVDVEYKNTQYGSASRDVAKPGFAFEQWYHNGGSQPLTGKFSKTKSLTSSFSWSITEGLKIGTENSFKVGVPGVVGGDLKFKTELELNSHQGKTKTEIETFTVENTIPVAPGKSVKAVFTVIEREVEVPWTADVIISGFMALWLEPKYNGHWLWFMPIGMLANSEFIRYGNGLRYRAKGTFKGVRGVETTLTTEECDYQHLMDTGKCISTYGVKMVEHKMCHGQKME